MADRIINPRYPHLLPVDIPVWERFLKLHGADYDRFEYDIRVGLGRDPGPTFGKNIRQMGIDLSQRRIDAIGHKIDRIDLFEITRRAGLKALGQCRAYFHLYNVTFKPALPIRMNMICEEIGTDLAQVYLDGPVKMFILPESGEIAESNGSLII